jgi:hypothetical protein
MNTPTFAAFLTPEGIIVAGGLITAFIQLLKGVFPPIDERVPGAILAFGLSAALYAITAVVVGVSTPDAGLTVIASWLACATAAVGVHSTARFAGNRTAA